MTAGRCADVSEAAGEPLSATATHALNWLLLEVRGSWPRDVSDLGALDPESRAEVTAWLGETPSSRLHFIRRPGRGGEPRLAFVVRATERHTEVRRLEVADGGLATGGEVVHRPLVLVCAHGTRDACCALRGSAVFGALESHVAPEDLWLSSHQGGHRYAANVLVLPSGIQLGRVTPSTADRVVGATLAGSIDLEHYRGRTAYTRREQAAEHAIRASEGLVHIDDLVLVGDDGTHVRFLGLDGREFRALPEEVPGPAVPASCGTEPEPQPHVAARLA